LLQYNRSGTNFARIKIKGKTIRESLGTAIRTDAEMRLVDVLKKKLAFAAKVEQKKVAFSDSVDLFKKRVQQDSAMKERSKPNRRGSVSSAGTALSKRGPAAEKGLAVSEPAGVQGRSAAMDRFSSIPSLQKAI